MTQINLEQLSELQAINKKLVSGYHISEQDTTLWQQLDQEIESYQALFAALGHDLQHDARGFYYLASDESTPNMGKISRAIALTVYIAIEHFANQGKDPLNALFDEVVDLELMQTLVQLNKHLFDQLEIFSGSDLRKDVLLRMVRLGLAREVEQGFMLLAPIYRYIDALMEVNEEQYDSEDEL
ncbi:condensin complex protein MksE [Pseudoalteromonas sp. T1lg65]|uniref:condensin complex protein MksE n=1 Tax=Pseudoalteromonas sp. T1lg65 TaxID=2077101 RepID=UPI003F7A1757